MSKIQRNIIAFPDFQECKIQLNIIAYPNFQEGKMDISISTPTIILKMMEKKYGKKDITLIESFTKYNLRDLSYRIRKGRRYLIPYYIFPIEDIYMFILQNLPRLRIK